jgi:hypothetical protein
LRSRGGVDFERVRRCVGIDLLTPNLATFERFAAAGLAALVGQRLVPTPAGLAVAEALAAALAIPAA